LTRLAGTPPREGDHVPRWDAPAGVLMFGGQGVLTVAIQAVEVRATLALFQTAGWPANVETRHTGDNKKKHVLSLNSELSVIEFYSSGSSSGVGWRVKPSG
jgi:hypothetical protein